MKPLSKSNPQPARGATAAAAEPGDAPMAPGDEAPRGTPGTGENVCRRCGGTGTIDGARCPDCQGRGTVTAGIGGA